MDPKITIRLSINGLREYFELYSLFRVICFDYCIEEEDGSQTVILINLTAGESRRIRKTLKKMERQTRRNRI
ncbi:MULTISPECIES: hypothetical protein [unclassified Streptomyces]|uniref:hypothetical protein n=1 Tax=unclassified Streptomyces TaxID=2593676 RepID=UPI0022AEF4E6|nr:MULTISPECIES: hypothetical protein [unclassified Streptomyces]MCZ4097331.1 hypothetical protein [Streptomyces sp. H39-C1]MCZ4120635.1 hypothetical protein [Streptomyces sp. H39-S7]